MRSARLLAVLVLILAPSIAAAQDKNPFTDSWFWGAKGGLAILRTGSQSKTKAPAVGAEWLITRSKFGLYVAFDQAYFGCITNPCPDSVVSTVEDAPTRGVVRRVNIRDMRRFTTEMFMFPHVWADAFRPYFGLGYAFNFVVDATSDGDQFANASARDTVLARIQSAKSRSSFVGTFGLQLNINRFAPFVQATAMPTQGNGKFLINGRGFTYYLEGGLRFNFGSAIEKLR
jgi:hypothetical protein